LIKASDVDPQNVSDHGWGGATTCSYTVYQGFGTHNEMLEAEAVEKNAGIIVDILSRTMMDDKS
jgi:thioesterase domain-containing protein